LDGEITVFNEQVETFRTALDEGQARWKAQIRDIDGLNGAVKQFASLAETSRALIKAAVSLPKLAGQLVELNEDNPSRGRGRGRRLPTEINQARKAAEEARQMVVERLKQVRYFWRQARWLTERFPEAELCDVEGLVKLVDRTEIEAWLQQSRKTSRSWGYEAGGKAETMNRDLAQYGELFTQIKVRIRRAQVKATLSANAEMILMYWDIGRMIHNRQQHEGWGAKVIPQLSQDIRNELPEIKGFSERNLKRMIAFYREYSSLSTDVPQAAAQLPSGGNEHTEKVPQPVAQLTTHNLSENLQQLVAKIPWGHHILLIEKIKDLSARLWYMHQTIEQGWSRNVLGLMIESKAFERQGAAVTNFEKHLPDPQSDLACQTLKDPYIFDFLTLTEPFQERELETELIKHLERFLLELGRGFAFVGRQYHIEVGDKDFYIDLLFYHLELRCFVVIELKKGTFKPEYAGKTNFYCSVVDDRLKHENDQPTIGLILCQEKDRVLAEYSLRDIQKPIGVSEYELTSILPETLKSSLPTVEEIEAELSRELEG
jgi:predicted nuclease of restriction endonuclease-like (RecB) superfamily